MYFSRYCVRKLTERLEIKVINAIKAYLKWKQLAAKVIFVKRKHVRRTNKLYMKFTVYLQTTVCSTNMNLHINTLSLLLYALSISHFISVSTHTLFFSAHRHTHSMSLHIRSIYLSFHSTQTLCLCISLSVA